MNDKTEALKYHEQPTPGKVAVSSTKPCNGARDLSLAYSPGVAYPCLEIEKNKEDVYRYTSKGNLVAVISNGTAVLGLGDIGPEASKPVMEGKGVLFKTFAGINVFDIEVAENDPKKFVEVVAAIAPTFGGINLEDIKAPECFYIETELKKRLDIPVFHDDQHGTAIIASAALINALEIVKKPIETVKLVVSGAGAAAIACAKILLELGLSRENLLMVDSKGVIYKGRKEGMNEFKEEFACETPLRTLAEAVNNSDVFFGLSGKDLLTPEMLLSMAQNPIVFAMANPDPEIDYNLAKSTRSDVIVATGRSDYPNQVNNVLGFPYIFRGALDVRAKTINEEMKMAAVRALARLAKESVPGSVKSAYDGVEFSFGPEYLIPKPFDPRVLYYVAPAVAEAAMQSGVARKTINVEEYTVELKAKQNQGRVLSRKFYQLAKKDPHRKIALPEATNEKVLKAASMAAEEGIAIPVLIGERTEILKIANNLEIDLSGVEILDPHRIRPDKDLIEKYLKIYSRKGKTLVDAERAIYDPHVLANLMVATGKLDGVICGIDQSFPTLMRSIIETVGLKEGAKCAGGVYMVSIGERVLFFVDSAINIELTPEKLSDIVVMTCELAKSLDIEPRVALLSFSNFGSTRHPSAQLMRETKQMVNKIAPKIVIDGEMQADAAVVTSILKENYPFADLKEAANILVFPTMEAGNIAFKLLQRLGGAQVVGPIVLGLNAPAYVLQRHASEDEIFNMITVAAGTVESTPSLKPEVIFEKEKSVSTAHKKKHINKKNGVTDSGLDTSGADILE